MMENPGNGPCAYPLKIWSDEVEIEGEINCLDKFYIEVRITKPYTGLKKSLSISGPGKINPNDILLRFKNLGKDFLLDIYNTLRKLDRSINRYAYLCQSYQQELKSLELIHNVEIRNRINSKLEDWFFFNFPFVGMRQKSELKFILKSYLYDGSKIYLETDE